MVLANRRLKLPPGHFGLLVPQGNMQKVDHMLAGVNDLVHQEKPSYCSQPTEGGGLCRESKRSFEVPPGDTTPSAKGNGNLQQPHAEDGALQETQVWVT